MWHGNAVTSIPEIVHIAVKPVNASAVYFDTTPGSKFLIKRQTEMRAQPRLAIYNMQAAYSAFENVNVVILDGMMCTDNAPSGRSFSD
jgi:hypothetical protein